MKNTIKPIHYYERENRKILREMFPCLSPMELTKISQDCLANNEGPPAALNSLKDIFKACKTKNFLLRDIRLLQKSGFSINHILLLAKAPDIKDEYDLSSTKDELLDLWQSGLKIKNKINIPETTLRAPFPISALTFMVGACGCGIYGAGYLAHNQDVIDTGNIVTRFVTGPASSVIEAATNFNQATILQTALTLAGATATLWAVNALRKKETDIDLKEKLIIPYFNSREDKEKYGSELKKIPKNLHHLLSHLKAEEFCLFLLSNDNDRFKILKMRPPSLEQRYLCIDAQEKSWVAEKLEKLQESVEPWSAPILGASRLQLNIQKMRGQSVPDDNMVPRINRSSNDIQLYHSCLCA